MEILNQGSTKPNLITSLTKNIWPLQQIRIFTAHLNILRYMRYILVVTALFLTFILKAQIHPSPYHVVHNHLYYLEEGHRNIEVSASSFDPTLSLEIREELAENLKQILDAKGYFIHVNRIPKNNNYRDTISGSHIYTLINELPEITIEKSDSSWYYSNSLERDIPRLFSQTFPSWSRGLINSIPESLKVSVGGIALWKFLGLLLIIITSFFLFKIFEWIIDKVMQRAIWKRFSLEPQSVETIHRISRYAGIVIFLWLLARFLPLLMLDIYVSQPLYKILSICIAIALMMLSLKVVDLIVSYFRKLTNATETKMDNQLLPIVTKTVKLLISIFFIIRVLYLLDVNVTALIAGLSISGLALALAAQDTVKNLIGSVMIFFDKPFQVGDYISAMGIEGTVEEVGFRSSRIRKIDTSLITIPNGNLTNATMINYGVRQFRIFETTLGFTYDSESKNLKAYMAELKDFLQKFKGIKQDTFYVNLRNLSASSIDIFFRVYIDALSYNEELEIREELIFVIIEMAQKNNLSFAFPSTSLYVEKQ